MLTFTAQEPDAEKYTDERQKEEFHETRRASSKTAHFDGKSSSLPNASLLLRKNQRFTFKSDKVVSAVWKHNTLL